MYGARVIPAAITLAVFCQASGALAGAQTPPPPTRPPARQAQAQVQPPAQTNIRTTRRDSAGVAIVESTATAVTPAPLVVDTTPFLRVGVPSGTADTTNIVRLIGDARVLRSGVVVVGDDHDGTLRFYSRYGNFETIAGVRGSGVGELRSVRLLDSRGDTLVACCAPGIALYSAAGKFLSATPPFREEFLGVLQGGRYLVRRTSSETGAFQGQKGVVKSLLMDTLFTVNTLGVFGARVAGLPSRIHVGVFNPDPNPLGLTITYLESPFEPESYYAPSGAGFVYSDGRNLEARTYAATGRLTRIVRIARPPAQLTPATADSYRQAILRKYSVVETRRYIEWVLQQYQVPQNIPALRGLKVSPDGRIWMREHAFPAGVAANWHLFAADGSYEGSLQLPSRWRVHQIGADFVLVSEPVSAGNYVVSLHRLTRRPPPAAGVR